jgi:hypothetical protein
MLQFHWRAPLEVPLDVHIYRYNIPIQKNQLWAWAKKLSQLRTFAKNFSKLLTFAKLRTFAKNFSKLLTFAKLRTFAKKNSFESTDAIEQKKIFDAQKILGQLNVAYFISSKQFPFNQRSTQKPRTP